MHNTRLAMLVLGALAHGGVLAHEGHGMFGLSHWHTTDTLGFVGPAIVAAAVWLIGRSK